MGPDDLGAAVMPMTGPIHRAQIPDGYAALIKIKDRSGETPHVDEETRRMSHLSTLLHEMLHVFFGVYMCLCLNACRKRHADEIGRNGHRKSWQLAALTVEEGACLFWERRWICQDELALRRMRNMRKVWMWRRELGFNLRTKMLRTWK